MSTLMEEKGRLGSIADKEKGKVLQMWTFTFFVAKS